MRLAAPSAPTYPVDRYLESSNKFEMVNLIDDDLWRTEPALRPEDEIILRKLHDMLQSTAEDLKVLSQELGQHHAPGVQVKTAPMPLDEDFNNRVHIEEIVNGKFHGHKIIDPSTFKNIPAAQDRILNQTFVKEEIRKPVSSVSVQNHRAPILKSNQNKNLGITRTKTIQISESKIVNCSHSKYDKPDKVKESVSYSEIAFKYDPIPSNPSPKRLNIQHMPSINIRTELKEQKVLHLDIIPENMNQTEVIENKNIAVVELKHEIATQPQLGRNIHRLKEDRKEPIRKVTVMSVGESSESANNNSSDYQSKFKNKGRIQSTMKASPKTTERYTPRKGLTPEKKNPVKELNKVQSHLNLDEWKKKLGNVYGKPSISKNNKMLRTKSNQARLNSKNNVSDRSMKKGASNTKPRSNILNNAEYIPYSHLTLGGVRVSDIERELSDGPIKNDAPLSPILHKLTSSHENSTNVSPRNLKDKAVVLSKSDENLLQDVLDLEDQISKTITSNNEIDSPKISPTSLKKDQSDTSNCYSNDEFEEAEKTDKSTPNSSGMANDDENKSENVSSNNKHTETDSNSDAKDTTFNKAQNLSLKNTVDIHEFIHSIDTQDNATQSNTTHIISLKETQTSPRNESSNMKPTNNDLWSSIDPKGEIENLFKLEKELIKKLIIDEYGDLLKESITKPSTSKDINEYDMKNMITSQKNTQTSPLHMKCVMTSPTRTKTRTTSPFTLNLTIDQQTSPMIFLNDKELHLDHTDNMSEVDDIGISINLSSPRFSLRLPQTSREVLSNMDNCSQITSDGKVKNTGKRVLPVQIKAMTSSTSVDADGSSSEISSLGEVKFRLKRRLRKNRIATISESSSTSTVSKSSSDIHISSFLPMKSEGELSLRQRTVNSSRRNDNHKSKTDDEKSLGQC
ncbi:zinc finger protein MSN2-like [Plutella xylostella]|uniref:zinc finger protein MSN2-like n=1 Tax=Plutella xylostella TaxID=51655 RepID=UPI002032C12C|nr:zinc finger protein MSN2-like [Plutella xylostella]